MPSPRKNLDWTFLTALNVGERYEVDIAPSRSEIVRKVSPTQRKTYLRAMNAAWRLSQGNDAKFIIRLGDFRKKEEFDKAYIWCVEKDGKRMEKLPPVGGFRGAVYAHKKNIEAQRELTAQVIEERAKLAEKRAPGKPTHIREVTVDDQRRLVELVLAHANGATIQRRSSDGVWITAPEPDWSTPVARLRIKPAPAREVWVLYARGDVGIGEKAMRIWASPDKPPSTVDPTCVVHYREVLPEEEE